MHAITFADNLKDLRRQSGLTQKQLATKLGVGLSTVAMWESGARQPDYNMLNNISDFFDVSFDYLMTGTVQTTNDDILAMRDLLRTRPEMKMLFSVSKNATKADIQRAVAIIEALKKQSGK